MTTHLKTLVQHARETEMYGCTADALRRSVEATMTFKFDGAAGMGRIAMSIISDAQEEMAHGQISKANQSMNSAKWVIRTYLTPDRE